MKNFPGVYTELRNQECYSLYLPNINKVMLAWIGQKEMCTEFYLENMKKKRLSGRPGCRWEGNSFEVEYFKQ